MKTQLKINGELKDVEIENGEITIIEPEKKETGWEMADYGDHYYCIGTYMIDDYPEAHQICDKGLFDNANYFTNKKLAESIYRMQALQRQMFRWQAENDVLIDLHSDRQKWIISDNYEFGIKEVDYYKTGFGFMPVFSSKEKAKECLEEFKDELTWLFTEFKWRMDA